MMETRYKPTVLETTPKSSDEDTTQVLVYILFTLSFESPEQRKYSPYTF